MNPYERQKYSFLALRAKFSKTKTSCVAKPLNEPAKHKQNSCRTLQSDQSAVQADNTEKDAEKLPISASSRPQCFASATAPDGVVLNDENAKVTKGDNSCNLRFETEVARSQQNNGEKSHLLSHEVDVEAGEPTRNVIVELYKAGSSPSVRKPSYHSSERVSLKQSSKKSSLSLCKRKRKPLRPTGGLHLPHEILEQQNKSPEEENNTAEGGTLILNSTTENLKKLDDDSDFPIWLEPDRKEIYHPEEYYCYPLPFLTTAACRPRPPRPCIPPPPRQPITCDNRTQFPALPPRYSPPPPPPLYSYPRQVQNSPNYSPPFPPKPDPREYWSPRSREHSPVQNPRYSPAVGRIVEREYSVVGTNVANDEVCQTPSCVQHGLASLENGRGTQRTRSRTSFRKPSQRFSPQPEDHFHSMSILNMSSRMGPSSQTILREQSVSISPVQSRLERPPPPSPDRLTRSTRASKASSRKSARSHKGTTPAEGIQTEYSLAPGKSQSTVNLPTRSRSKPSLRPGRSKGNISLSRRVPSSQSLRPHQSKSKINLVDRSCTTYSSCATQVNDAAKIIGSACARRTKSGNPICSVSKINIPPPPPPPRPRLLVKKTSVRVFASKKTSVSNLKRCGSRQIPRLTSKGSVACIQKTSFAGQTDQQQDDKCCCHCCKKSRRKSSSSRNCCIGHRIICCNAKFRHKAHVDNGNKCSAGSCGRNSRATTPLHGSCEMQRRQGKTDCSLCCEVCCHKRSVEQICAGFPLGSGQNVRQKAEPAVPFTCPRAFQEPAPASCTQELSYASQRLAQEAAYPYPSPVEQYSCNAGPPPQLPSYACPRPAPTCGPQIPNPVQPLSAAYAASGMYLANALQDQMQAAAYLQYQDLPYCPTRLSVGPQPYPYSVDLPKSPEGLYDRGSIPYAYDPRTQRISFAPLDTLIRLSNDTDYANVLQQRMSTIAAKSARDSQFQNPDSVSQPNKNKQSVREDTGPDRKKSNTEDRRRWDSRMGGQNVERKQSQHEEPFIYQPEDTKYFDGLAKDNMKGSVQNISGVSLDIENVQEQPKQRPSRSPSTQIAGANGRPKLSTQEIKGLQKTVKSENRADVKRESQGKIARQSSSNHNMEQRRSDANIPNRSNTTSKTALTRTERSGSNVASNRISKTNLNFKPSKSNLAEQKRPSSPNVDRWRRASALALEQARPTGRTSKPQVSRDGLKRSSRERLSQKDAPKQGDTNRFSTAFPGYDYPFDIAQDYYRYSIPYPPDGRMSYAPRPSQAPIDLNRLSMFPHPDNWGPERIPRQSLYPAEEAYQIQPPLLRAPRPTLNQYTSIRPPVALNPPANEFLDIALLQSLLPAYAPPPAPEPRGTISAYQNTAMSYSWPNQPAENCGPPVMPAGDSCVPSAQCPCCGATAPPSYVDPCCTMEVKAQNFQNDRQAISSSNPLPDLSAAQMTQLIPGCTADGTQFFILPLYSNVAGGGASLTDQAKDKSVDRCTDGERKSVCCKKKRPSCKQTKCSRKFDMRVQGHACKANGCSSNNDCWCCPCKCNPCSENGCSGFSGGCS